MDNLGHVEFFKCHGAGRNRAEYRTDTVQVSERIDSKSRNIRNLVGKVGGIMILEGSLSGAVHDFVDRLLDRLHGQAFLINDLQAAMYTSAHRVARNKVQ